ncbi:aldo/keto reductase [Companilactobacillus sp. DQM5]|uniref:aldo/keto reductase n=1 Tax=Companilactobacillus sp. DQM5 TaxID=3463359 RepID=UPI004057E260
MKSIKIGNSNWKASAIALGIMRMNVLDSNKAVEVIETAYKNGINFIDTADIYDLGKSDEVFGEALKKSSLTRDNFYIQSKGGIINNNGKSKSFPEGLRYDFSKKHIIESVEGSLKRLKTDYLDSFLLHRPDTLMEVEQIAEAFDELETSGKVRHFGVSNFNPEQYKLVQSGINQKLMINQLQFSIMHTGMIDFGIHTNMTDNGSISHDGSILEFSRRKNITIQAWSPFQYGFFDGTFINNEKFPELNQKLKQLGDKYDVGKNAIATAWILKHPANMQVILGTMNPKHIEDSAAGGDVVLTNQEWYDVYFAAGNDLP